MKTFGLVVVLICLGGVASLPVYGEQRWSSPDHACTVELVSKSPGGEVRLMAASGGAAAAVVTDSPLIESPVSREYGGVAWFSDVTPRWVDGRYLVFEGEDRLAVVDAVEKRLILNTAFEALVRAPAGDRWMAIKYRPIGRKQETIPANFRDTLYVIDLPQVIKASVERKEEQKEKAPVIPFSHLRAVVLPGHAVARPVWKSAGDFAVAVWTGAGAETFGFEAEDLRLKGKTPVEVPLSDEAVRSAWIVKTVPR
ncbi:hypothetical protein [Verrucomicrobium sp. BvORR034]|uniref:hypothetical protein n=1 Tax=Verrucomicrobium sp. BvORR034 TaxID=1396418 RepID=UPI0006787442|nr:hypothetical protein [Verrucomicrobium sp. BvORR034]